MHTSLTIYAFVDVVGVAMKMMVAAEKREKGRLQGLRRRCCHRHCYSRRGGHLFGYDFFKLKNNELAMKRKEKEEEGGIFFFFESKKVNAVLFKWKRSKSVSCRNWRAIQVMLQNEPVPTPYKRKCKCF